MGAGLALTRRFARESLNALRAATQQSKLKNSVVIGFVIGFEGGLYALFLAGFRFLNQLGGAGMAIVPHLFSVYFLGLALMLIISGLATAYATLFRAGDVPLLFTSPLRPAHVTLLKLTESAGLSSWAFGFVVLPFVAAYATFASVSLLFVLWVLLFSIPLMALSSSLAVTVTLCAGRWFPQRGPARRFISLLLLTATFGILLAIWLQRPVDDQATRVTMSTLVPGLRLATHPLMPSMWTAEGIMALSRGEFGRGLLMWLLLTSTALTSLIITEKLGAAVYHTAWTRVSAGNSAIRRSLLGRGLPRLFAPLPADVRAIIIKDIRIFFRDPMQWSQVLVFFGLLSIYFANLRNFQYDELPDVWRNLIAFLNAFGVATVASSLAARFVYPQLSLEGHGYWVLGLSPTRPTRIILIKFFASATFLTLITTTLMLLSTSMINAPAASRAIILTITICLSISVTAMATGLGAIFLDQQHRNPAAIISGFGGTLNLLLSLGFTFAVVFPPAVAYHLQSIGKLSPAAHTTLTLLIYGWILALTYAATVIPLRLGIRALNRRDF